MNLYDVHAPYSPSRTSPLRSFGSPRDILENLSLTCVLPKVSNHSYLRPGFHLSEHNRSMLLARYHAAIELMDAKLESFYESARRTGLLDDTLLVITSDHGEAFGEHGLYLHDASVYETHLHVPLWIHHPGRAAEVVDDVVTTRHLFGLLEAAVLNRRLNETVLDPGYRRDNLAALAEHFHYPRIEGLLERYRHNQAAAIVADRKIVRRGDVLEVYDLLQDPHELNPKPAVCAQAAKLLSHDHGDLAVVHRAAEHVCRGSVARRAA